MISEGFVTNGAKVYVSSRDGKACEKAAAELTALGTMQRLFLPGIHLVDAQADRRPGLFLRLEAGGWKLHRPAFLSLLGLQRAQPRFRMGIQELSHGSVLVILIMC